MLVWVVRLQVPCLGCDRVRTDGFKVPVEAEKFDDVRMLSEGLVAQEPDLHDEGTVGVSIAAPTCGREEPGG